MSETNPFDHPERRPGEAFVGYVHQLSSLRKDERVGKEFHPRWAGYKPLFRPLARVLEAVVAEVPRLEGLLEDEGHPEARKGLEWRLSEAKRKRNHLRLLVWKDEEGGMHG